MSSGFEKYTSNEGLIFEARECFVNGQFGSLTPGRQTVCQIRQYQ